jgi:protein-L-isoaspartate O-methyltransferase
MPNDRQFQPKTKIVATRDVKSYRATIADIVQADDRVLEIGCEWGTTTRVLARHATQVLGTDISRACIERARATNPDLAFAVVDAFDLRAVQALGDTFTVIYIDVSGLSGFRSTLDVLALLNSYAALLDPRTIVVKSGALLNLARRLEARN